MELEDLIKELCDIYKNHFALMGFIGTTEEAGKFTNAIAFAANLYKIDESVKSIVEFGDMELLNDFVISKINDLWARYSPLTSIIISYVKEKDCDNLREFMNNLYNDVMESDVDEFDELYNGKLRLVNDFYEDVLEGKCEKITNYVREIDRYSHLSLLTQKYVDRKYTQDLRI